MPDEMIRVLRDLAVTLPHSAGISERYTQDRRRKNLETDEEEQVSTDEVMHCRLRYTYFHKTSGRVHPAAQQGNTGIP